MMKALLVLAVACIAAPAMADFYVAGNFNVNWDPGNAAYKMTDLGGGKYQFVLSGETDGAHEFKVTDGDWTEPNYPTSNAKVWVAGGTATITFDSTATPNDGWLPNTPRAGWVDPAFGWDIMGSFNGWSGPVATMTARGNGIYDVSFVVAAPGSYEFKFRKLGDWSLSVGDGFGNGSNIPYTTTVANQVVNLSLDVTHGRYSLVPEPATMALLALGGLALLRRR